MKTKLYDVASLTVDSWSRPRCVTWKTQICRPVPCLIDISPVSCCVFYTVKWCTAESWSLSDGRRRHSLKAEYTASTRTFMFIVLLLYCIVKCFDTIGWVIRPVKNRLWNDLNCVNWYVKPCSINVKVIGRGQGHLSRSRWRHHCCSMSRSWTEQFWWSCSF